MRKSNSTFLFAFILFTFFIYKTFFNSIERPPGMLIKSMPIQKNLEEKMKIDSIDGYHIFAKSEYEIKARVLGVENYWLDGGSKVSPLDFALGWHEMSDSSVLKYLSINQYGRFYFYSWKGDPPIDEGEIVEASANVHLIPKNIEILNRLKKIKTGHIVTLKGFLVDVTNPNGFSWKSSMTRTDTGNGACELLYVTEINYY